MMHSIVNTVPNDIDFICSLFDAAIEYQKKNGYPVWKVYDKALLQKEIKEKRQYKILIADEIACVFSVCYEDKMVWRERDNGDAIYLHRIVVNPKYKGRQLFGNILQWSQQHILKINRPHLRMDTWADNPNIIQYYQNFRFKIVDYYTTPDDEALPIQQRENDVVLLEYHN